MNYNIDSNIYSFNNLNQVKNEDFLIFNNNFSSNENIINPNESEDISNLKEYNLLSKKIKRKHNNIIDFPLKINISKNEKKKIFDIEHIKEKMKYETNIKNQKKIKSIPMDKKEKEKFSENNSLNENRKIFENSKNKNINMLFKCSLIDKSKDENSIKKHNKFSDDNLQRKCKYLVLSNLIQFINKKLYTIYNGNIGNNIYRKEILTLNKSQIENTNTMYNRLIVYKKISDILSDNISHKYTNYLPQHNKLLIERLKEDKDKNKSLYFNKLFNLTFKDCFDHFIGKKSIEELKGMKSFECIKIKLGKDEKYVNKINYYLNNYEKILNEKKTRKRKKNV